MKNEFEKYGNEMTISGFLLANGKESHLIWFPNAIFSHPLDVTPTSEQLNSIIRQLDVLEITGNEKIVLRKSQRNISQSISWNVFRRDNFRCVYCGSDNVPMTVDHVILWENMILLLEIYQLILMV